MVRRGLLKETVHDSELCNKFKVTKRDSNSEKCKQLYLTTLQFLNSATNLIMAWSRTKCIGRACRYTYTYTGSPTRFYILPILINIEYVGTSPYTHCRCHDAPNCQYGNIGIH